ncbi:MAG: carbohydrate ABC transporter substrate-binding protein [Lachnospiraceae bacterium]|nr:carbohydrate ABC transporter substrate-binding protein [Lachnospiraceae bacterium]
MKKKIVSIMLTAAMTATLLAGCGGAAADTAAPAAAEEAAPAEEAAADSAAPADDTAAADTATADTADAAADTAAAASDEGKVLNIQCWNEEFKSRITDHYPGYEADASDPNTGKIGDVTVKWIITPTDDNAYQNHLDEILPTNESAAADDKVDIFLVEADYALKYVNADPAVAMSMDDLGIAAADISDQFKYTQDIVTDSNGKLRGLSWQACSAGLIYNRDIAKEVLGTEEPDEVQEKVKDWATFNKTAEELKKAGYFVESTVNDSYRVYSNNVSKPWVDGTTVQIDANIEKWVEDSKALVDAKETNTYDLWSDDWSKGFYPEGKVFAYFGPAWLINFSMAADAEGSVANAGRWGLCVGPQSFYWGGTWICAATGTDNPALVKDIMLTMTTDKAVLKEIVEKDSDCVNSPSLLKELAADSSFGNKILGGQNPYQQLADGAEKVDMSKISDYDQGCNESFQAAMKDYFEGKVDYDKAIANFQTAVKEKYPELSF